MFRNLVEEADPKHAPVKAYAATERVEDPHSELDLSPLLREDDDLYDNMPCTD